MFKKRMISNILKLAKKDLLIEFRRPPEFLSIIVFTLSSILVSSFIWQGGLDLTSQGLSATLWIVIYFSTILSLTTNFTREIDRGTLDGLRTLPCSPYSVLMGKVFYAMIILIMIIMTAFISSVLFFNLDMNVIAKLLIIFLIGSYNLALIGSLVSSLVMYSEGKNLLLSFLFFPVSVPVLLPCTRATEKIISGTLLSELLPELKLLLAFLFISLAISILIFQNVFLE